VAAALQNVAAVAVRCFALRCVTECWKVRICLAACTAAVAAVDVDGIIINQKINVAFIPKTARTRNTNTQKRRRDYSELMMMLFSVRRTGT